MNILYIDHYAGSLDMGMEFRPYYLAREWQKLGHKVRIVGASFSHLRVKNPEVQKDFELKDIDGIQYQWIKTRSYDHNGVARALTMLEFCGKLWWHAKEIAEEFKPDVLITSSTYPMDTWPAQRIVKYSGAKLIHENHDLWPLTLTAIGGMSENHPFVKLCGWALKSAIKHSDEIVCVLPFAYEYFQQFGLKDLRKFHHIPNGVALQDWENPEPLPEEHQYLFDRLKGKFVVLYLGSHSDVYALDKLIDAAKSTCDGDIRFVFVGQGNDKAKLVQYAKENDCQNVIFLPGVSKKAVPNVLAKADVLYSTIGIDMQLGKYGVSSNKIYDYAMAAVPVLFSYESRNKEILDADCGYEVFPKTADEICKQITRVKSLSEEERKSLGDNGHKWVLANCEYSVLAKKFEELFV